MNGPSQMQAQNAVATYDRTRGLDGGMIWLRESVMSVGRQAVVPKRRCALPMARIPRRLAGR